MKKCSVEGCLNKYYCKGLCRKHYEQMWTYGCIGRSKKDPNEFQVDGDTCKIFIYNNFGIKIAETIIDSEDIEKCKAYKWSLLNGYIISKFNLHLTNIILGVKTNRMTVIDHINGNPLDNRKQNLQVITHQQNIIKMKMMKTNTSGYRGVGWNIQNKKWRAGICFNRKPIYLGYFDVKEEAALAYNKKAEELFGEFANLNFVEGSKL